MSVVKKVKGLTVGMMHRYLRDIVQGLAVLHDHGIIHQDLKPQNILLTPEGRCKISDFGTAALMSQTPLQPVRWTELLLCPPPPPSTAPSFSGGGASTSAIILNTGMLHAKDNTAIGEHTAFLRGQNADHVVVAGTAVYMAPEAFDGTLSPATDVFALGMSLIHCMTDTQPWSHLGITQILELVSYLHGCRPLHPIPEDLPGSLTDLIGRCVDPIPQQRPRVPDIMDHVFLCTLPKDPSIKIHPAPQPHQIDATEEDEDIPIIEG
uniref:Protein kinase domain-containing protein n=1 Tax=Eutreptiella gymnastica TaxID=73025 RepID=A0A7S1NBY2_9EUGL